MVVRFQPIPTLFNELDSLLKMPFVSYGSERTPRVSDVAMKDNGDSLTVIAHLPGVGKDDIAVKLQEGILTITAERKQPELKENEQWIRNEIRYGAIERSVALPYEVDADAIAASFENGVLRVVLPKHVSVKPRSIAIK